MYTLNTDFMALGTLSGYNNLLPKRPQSQKMNPLLVPQYLKQAKV